MHVGIVAGESSGDRLGAGLIEALRELDPGIECAGVAGPRMIAAGCAALHSTDELSVMGIAEVIGHYPRLKTLQRSVTEHFLVHRPDIFVGVDAPDFNLPIARRLKEAGIRTVHYVSPSVWAWRRGRARQVARSVDLLLAILPFEADCYAGTGLRVEYVGHPIADEIPLEHNRAEVRDSLGWEQGAPYLALLPGSRVQEWRHHAARFIATAELCAKRLPKLRIACAAVSAHAQAALRLEAQRTAPELAISFHVQRAREVLAAADVALVKSGTATLEAMLCGCPLVVAYHMSWLSFVVLRMLVETKYIALPNILAGTEIAPEFVQAGARPERMAEACLRWLTEPDLAARYHECGGRLHERLRRGAARRAAETLIRLANGRSSGRGS
jgi:lipid-A-disaccharide synthase